MNKFFEPFKEKYNKKTTLQLTLLVPWVYSLP